MSFRAFVDQCGLRFFSLCSDGAVAFLPVPNRRASASSPVSDMRARHYARPHPHPKPKPVDYTQPVVIGYTCKRCGAHRSVSVALREVVHADFKAPSFCPHCK